MTTLRDQSAVQALTNDPLFLRGSAGALRAKAHQSADRLRTVVTMIEPGRADRAVAFATAVPASGGIVDRHGGDIEMRPGRPAATAHRAGAVLRVRLPTHAAARA